MMSSCTKKVNWIHRKNKKRERERVDNNSKQELPPDNDLYVKNASVSPKKTAWAFQVSVGSFLYQDY